MKNAAPSAPVLILVVDDDEAVRDAVCDVVTMLGYTAEPASDARAVLDGFRPGLYDLVVTDLAMPIMNGLELARRLRALDPTLPITIFSATALPAEPSGEVTGITVARKPDVEALTRLIQRALGRS
jgi:two-component system response regulator FixJ